MRLDRCYCSVVLESPSLLGSGNDSGVSSKMFCSLEGKAGLWSPLEIFLGGIIC